ncbi:hypothetical protein CU098_004933, partial [Rhizopus stolonifer]
YVRYYLSLLLSSVFASDPLLKMKWANGQLLKKQQHGLQAGLPERNSYIESDFIKLAKTDEGDFEQVDYQWSCEA